MKLVRILGAALPIAIALSSRASLGSTGSGGAGGGSGGAGPIPGLLCNMTGALTVSELLPSNKRTPSEDPDTVSYADCVSNDTLTLTYGYSGDQQNQLEAYVLLPAAGGTDCLTATTRSMYCQRIAGVGKIGVGGMLVLSDYKLASILTGTGCTDTADGSGPSALTVYLIADPLSTTSIDYCTYAASIDLVGPSAPVDTTSEIGDSEIIVDFSSADSEATSFNIYCDAGGTPMGTTTSTSASSSSGASTSGAGGAGGAGGGSGGASASGGAGGTGGAGMGGAGAGGKGGAGGGGGSGPSLLPGCSESHVLVPGSVPDAMYLVGNYPSPGDEVDKVLGVKVVDGTEYACAVAALDDVDNIGLLSNVSCVVPQRTDDFFGDYRGDSGQAGGGLCTVGRGSSAFAATSGVIGLSLLAFASRRRRRRAPKR